MRLLIQVHDLVEEATDASSGSVGDVITLVIQIVEEPKILMSIL